MILLTTFGPKLLDATEEAHASAKLLGDASGDELHQVHGDISGYESPTDDAHAEAERSPAPASEDELEREVLETIARKYGTTYEALLGMLQGQAEAPVQVRSSELSTASAVMQTATASSKARVALGGEGEWFGRPSASSRGGEQHGMRAPASGSFRARARALLTDSGARAAAPMRLLLSLARRGGGLSRVARVTWRASGARRQRGHARAQAAGARCASGRHGGAPMGTGARAAGARQAPIRAPGARQRALLGIAKRPEMSWADHDVCRRGDHYPARPGAMAVYPGEIPVTLDVPLFQDAGRITLLPRVGRGWAWAHMHAECPRNPRRSS